MWVKSRKVGPGKRQQCWDDAGLLALAMFLLSAVGAL